MSSEAQEKPKVLTMGQVLQKVVASAACGGTVGAIAMGAHVMTLMWMHTMVCYSYVMLHVCHVCVSVHCVLCVLPLVQQIQPLAIMWLMPNTCCFC